MLSKKCKVCKQPNRPFRTTCSIECEAELGLRLLEKAKRAEAKHVRAVDKVRKEKLKSRSDWMREAQQAFNLYIRMRAIRFNHKCISSGAQLEIGAIGGGFDAGHYRSIGSAPHLRFNLNNCWGQSKKDNRYGSGASFEYRVGLIARRGLKVVEELESDNRVRKFDIEYLMRVKDIFKRKAKRIAKFV